MRSLRVGAIGLALLVVIPWAYGDVGQVVQQAIDESGVFPAGTVASVTVAGEAAVVDLSPQAVPPNFGDAQSDEMVKVIVAAFEAWPEVASIEVTVTGKPLWEYLPVASADGQSEAVPTLMALQTFAMSVPEGQLAGKKIALHPSHGSYWHEGYRRWYRAMRTFCGPNPQTRPPGWDGSTYYPSDYYYFTRGFQWASFYEDDMSPETIRFLERYLEADGAEVFVSRELDRDARDFDYNGFGYPNTSFPLPLWQVASKYYLQSRGDVPEWVWNEPTLNAQSDKDLRARAYYANYHGCDLSLSLHSNAANVGAARGTETYWYTSKYPWLQADAIRYAGTMNTGVVNAIRNYYDGFWAESMYPGGTTPPEWPSSSGTYRGYQHAGGSTTNWQNRGVKTSNFGEIRECQMPAVLCEIAFHDDWKFYPDAVFMNDQIWRATAAWGFYDGVCNYFGVTPKPRMAATVGAVSFPAVVGPGQPIDGTVTMQNNGMAWCWGDKWENMQYLPYTVWKLAATANDQIAAGAKIAIAPNAIIYPGETAEFSVAATAPTAEGLYTTEWQMVKDDAKGGAFGGVATAQVRVDATGPVITIGSPAASDYPYGCVTVQFSAVDEWSSVASISATLDGQPVASGDEICGLSIGSHTVVVTATDGVGNTSSQSVAFKLINTPGKSTAGGWIELAHKKATCGFVSQYVEGEAAPTGNVTYQDHDLGMTVRSVELLAMGIRGNRCSVAGTCTIDGEAGHWFRMDLVDNGEPGSSDAFTIYLDTGYKAGGTLGGGNIQIE